jgi:hypothetical protein
MRIQTQNTTQPWTAQDTVALNGWHVEEVLVVPLARVDVSLRQPPRAMT